MEGPPGIVMRFSSEPRHARVARAAVAAAAVLEGFSIDRIDDVRLIVDEAFNALRLAGAEWVSFSLAVGPARIALTVQGLGSAPGGDEFAVLAVLGDAIAPGWTLGGSVDGVEFGAVISAEPD